MMIPSMPSLADLLMPPPPPPHKRPEVRFTRCPTCNVRPRASKMDGSLHAYCKECSSERSKQQYENRKKK